jgi:hypothetical protein
VADADPVSVEVLHHELPHPAGPRLDLLHDPGPGRFVLLVGAVGIGGVPDEDVSDREVGRPGEADRDGAVGYGAEDVPIRPADGELEDVAIVLLRPE